MQDSANAGTLPVAAYIGIGQIKRLGAGAEAPVTGGGCGSHGGDGKASCGSSDGPGDMPPEVWEKIRNHPCYSEEAHHHYARMHVATKPATLGITMCLAGAALRADSGSTATKLVVAIVFQLVTTPVAGHLLGRFMGPGAGKVALFVGSLAYRGHEEREMGFRSILAESAPHLSVLELREIRDDTERAYREARALLERHDDVTGIYNIGAGNRGIARALEERGRGQTVVFIGHELTAHTRRFLLSGTMDAVIDQNPRVEARDAIERLVRAVRGEPEPALPPVRIQALFRENIPEV